MRASTPPVCTHCQSTKSPLWRRGAQQEVLCNACGLYWKHHGCYRPLSLKAAADRKQESNSSQDSLSDGRAGSSSSVKDLTFHDFMKVAKAKQNLMAHFSAMNSAAIASASSAVAARSQDPRKVTGGPLKTANILMAPGQYGYHGPVLGGMKNDISLPPLLSNRPDLSSPLPMSNTRRITAAPILPNLRSVLDSHRQQHQHQRSVGSMVMSGNADVSTPISVSVPPSVAKASTSLPLKFIINKGITMYQGDHVAVLGDDSQVYFAILLDFWLTEGGRRFCTLRWLLPHAEANIDASQSPSVENFSLGPIHAKVESMDAILDVFFSPYRESMTSETIRKRFLASEQADELAAKMLLSMN
jgi:hypothetical protein